MTDYARPDDPAFEPALWRLYRRFFDQAKRRRRWSVERTSPGDNVTRVSTRPSFRRSNGNQDREGVS